MADDKDGREKQAADEDRRQRERDVEAELERGDEPEPPIDPDEVDEFEAALEPLTFPATGREIVAAVGTRELESGTRVYAVADLLPDADIEAFDAPETVRERIRRPAVATAMKRVVEAAATLENEEFGRSQHEAFERTFRALSDIDELDDEEGVEAIADWAVDRIAEKETVPGSRDLRRQAAKYCRKHGYEVRNDEWLGV
ncbi:hypothetical protein SAMN04488067_101267 [Halorubrum xinjiangense]|uniref:Uncharacterized protein n=1 Tax=Halorubrum xinjiangense TaxID=261291 RepID=A0A1G7H921_9EURY|nr:hypothetical protein [Halorubrum xinjiangense]SDE96813.1 hypothetical protein SAMN04488067_101267 [Halorubrum xinjiangense]